MPFSSTGYLGDLNDVSVLGAVSGDVLTYDGTGWFPDTPPDWNNLATRVLNLEIQQATLPSTTDINNLSQLVTSRFNTVTTSNDQQDETIDLLAQGFASIKKSLNDLDALFIGHTGLSGAHTTAF
jgi:hypothetical protein